MKAYIMENRPVILYKHFGNRKCGECGDQAIFRVRETEIVNPGSGIKPYITWFWCGVEHTGA